MTRVYRVSRRPRRSGTEPSSHESSSRCQPPALCWAAAAFAVVAFQPLILLRNPHSFGLGSQSTIPCPESDLPSTRVDPAQATLIRELTHRLEVAQNTSRAAEAEAQRLRAELDRRPAFRRDPVHAVQAVVASERKSVTTRTRPLPTAPSKAKATPPLEPVRPPVVDVVRPPPLSRSRVSVSKSGPPIFIVKPDLHRHGGVFGEYKLFVGLLWALKEIGADHGLIESEADVAAARKQGKIGPSTIVVSDQYSPDGLIHAVQRLESKRFNIDFWGTPIQQARRGTVEAQYLVPYPNGINTFLGFRSQNNEFRSNPPSSKEPSALVWGKDLKYFTREAQRMLRAVVQEAGNELSVIYTTVQSKGGKSGVDGLNLPKVKNLGMLNAEQYQSLLSKVSVVIGLGDPVLGPTALDALEHGCALVQLQFSPPKVVKSVNPRLPWHTQHDAANRFAGAPWVTSTSFDRYPEAVKAALVLQRQQTSVASRLPLEFSDESIVSRVRGWVDSLPS